MPNAYNLHESFFISQAVDDSAGLADKLVMECRRDVSYDVVRDPSSGNGFSLWNVECAIEQGNVIDVEDGSAEGLCIGQEVSCIPACLRHECLRACAGGGTAWELPPVLDEYVL
jgi:hypothetical protein